MFRDRFLALRDCWLGDPARRRRIERLPLGRAIAKRHADRLFGVVTGFAQSQMLAAAVEAEVFEQLARRRMARSELDVPDALLRAVEALGLVEQRGDRVTLTVDGLVIASDPGIRAMIAHNSLLYRDLTDPLAALRKPGDGELAKFWPYRSGGDAAGYSALMSASQSFIAEALCDGYDFAAHRHVMDVGGGDGTFLAVLNARFPALAMALVELPEVATLAERKLAGRATVVAADDDAPLPRGADLVTLVRVLHDRDDDSALALLRRIGEALETGATLLIAEPMARQGRDAATVYFTAYFAAMGSGRLRTVKEIAALLNQAGFALKRSKRLSAMLDIVVARRR